MHTWSQGGMTTIVGVADVTLEAACAAAVRETGSVVRIANYLFPKGRVIGGLSPQARQWESCGPKTAACGVEGARIPICVATFHCPIVPWTKVCWSFDDCG